MKIFFSTIALFLIPIIRLLAHEGETEITDIGEADLIGPLIAIIIITLAVLISISIRNKNKKNINNINNIK